MGLFTRKKKAKPIKDTFVSHVSGAGATGDKAQSGSFQYSYIAEDFIQLERTYAESWACAKIVDIPVDDMFIYPRCIKGLSDANNKKLEEFSGYIQLDAKIKQALKAARLYGTAFLVMVTDDNLLSTPMNPNAKIMNLKNLVVIDRFHAAVLEWDRDISTPNFNEPLLYQFTIRNVEPFVVHHSRVIRIDGVKPLTANRWESGYNWYWGVSELVRVMNVVTQEEGIANGINYLMNEASIPILKIPDLQDALAGAPDALGGSPNDTVSPVDKLINNMNNLKSIYRTTYLDAGMDLSRLEASFANFDSLIDRFHTRLAAAADIPQTRFFGKSPAGMNATGDSDSENYAIHISSRQQKDLKPIYDKLDLIISKTLGITETIEYSFKPLLDMSDADKAKINLANAQRDQIYLANGVIAPEEVRQNLYDEEVYDINPDDYLMGLDEDHLSNMNEALATETASMPNQLTQKEIASEKLGASTNAKRNQA
jgi:phage-related protein (TIGR01555 family)